MAASATPLTILVTGANRGIGLAVVEQYSAQPNVRVIATARDPKKADALQALAKAKSNVSVVALDVADAKSVAGLPAALAALSPAVKALDVLINNAGVVQGSSADAAKPHGANAWGGLETESIANFLEVYRVNVAGTFDVSQRLLPLLRLAPSKQPKLINISSMAGQFEFTINAPMFHGGAAAYRASKAALNELSAVQAREYNAATVTAKAAAAAAPADAKLAAAAAAAAPLIAVVTVHPGIVETDMAAQAGFTGNPLAVSTAVSAAGIIKLTAEAKGSEKVKFIDAITGKEIPW